MLAKEEPDLVVVAPRWSEEHHAMGMAALRAGAHVFFEKPFTPFPAQADELLAEAAARGLRCAVAHQVRMQPSALFLRQQIEAGLIGELLEVSAIGSCDRRAGGEEMMILGCHVFDMLRMLVGMEPEW